MSFKNLFSSNKKNEFTIPESILLKGNLQAGISGIINGKIEGDINSTENLLIGRTGEVHGNIHCKNLTVNGKITGDIDCMETLVINDLATIEGNLQAKETSIDPAAMIKQSPQKEKLKPKEIKKAVVINEKITGIIDASNIKAQGAETWF